MIHMKRLILGKKIQNHVPFDTVLDMKPYLAPGHTSTQTMELIGIITHKGTKEQRPSRHNNKKREQMDIIQ